MKSVILIRLLTYYINHRIVAIDFITKEFSIYYLTISYYRPKDEQLYEDAYFINNIVGSWEIDYIGQKANVNVR